MKPSAVPLTVALIVAGMLCVTAAPSQALGPINSTLGFDYYRGPDQQATWRPMAEAEAEVDSFSATVGASHFDDNQTGRSWGITGTLKVPVAPRWKIVAAGTGFAGDSTDGAWRAKLGPQFQFGPDHSLGFYAAHYDDRFGNGANAIETEYERPLGPHVSGSAAVAVQRSNDLTGGDATLTLGWNLSEMFELTGDLGVSHNGSGLTGLLPPGRLIHEQEQNRRGRGQGSGNNTTTTTVVSQTSATALIGLRLHF